MCKHLEAYLDAQRLHTHAEVLLDHLCVPCLKRVLNFQFFLKIEELHYTFDCVITCKHEPSPLDKCFLLSTNLDLVPDCNYTRETPVILSELFWFLSKFSSPFLIEICQLLFPIEKYRQGAISLNDSCRFKSELVPFLQILFWLSSVLNPDHFPEVEQGFHPWQVVGNNTFSVLKIWLYSLFHNFLKSFLEKSRG